MRMSEEEIDALTSESVKSELKKREGRINILETQVRDLLTEVSFLKSELKKSHSSFDKLQMSAQKATELLQKCGLGY